MVLCVVPDACEREHATAPTYARTCTLYAHTRKQTYTNTRTRICFSSQVNNAGGQFGSPAAQISKKGWNAVIDTNLTGTFFMSQCVFERAFSPQDSGVIVSVIANMWNGFPMMSHTGEMEGGGRPWCFTAHEASHMCSCLYTHAVHMLTCARAYIRVRCIQGRRARQWTTSPRRLQWSGRPRA
jgi:NAD(P)-dependent dehydrogenase (short-subunit alcohol dehydrogenase family)